MTADAPSTYAPALADIYDAIYAFKDYDREVAYLVDLIGRERPGARTLLETACGTGLFLQRLQRDFEVAGLDLSPDMLARAAGRVPGAALHAADMAAFALGRHFDVVCCLFRSIAYVRTRERFHAAVAAMADHVAPGGLLVIEPFFTPATFRVGDVVLNEYRDARMKIAWMYASALRDPALGVFDIQYLVGTPAGVTHFTESHALGLFDADDYASAFAAAGLSLRHDTGGPAATGLYVGRKPG